MTPPALMLSALGYCIVHYATGSLQARNLQLDNIELHISTAKGARPVRLVEIGIEVDTPGLITRWWSRSGSRPIPTTRTREGLIEANETCLLHRTLTVPPKLKGTIATVAANRLPAQQPVDLTS